MDAKVKFTFFFKNGRTYDSIEELSVGQFKQIVETCKTSMREGVDGVLSFPDFAVRLSEVALVSWEVLE